MKNSCCIIAVILAGWLSTVAPAPAAVVPPQVSGADLYGLDVPETPFPEQATAERDVDRAFAQARTQNKRVLIDLGANWCADCRILAALLGLPQVHQFVDAHYVAVNVDVGRFNRNLDVPARFGIYDRPEGVPCILIAEPDGRLVNAGRTMGLVNAGHMDPQSVVNWLAYWAR